MWLPHNQPPTTLPCSDPSCFKLLNRLRRQLTIAHLHIIAHTTMALKDEAGNFSWVEFEPKFRSHLFKCAFSLLGELITPAAQRMYKKAIFVYILELLNQEGEDTFFTSKHGQEKIARTNWERKQTLPPSEPAPLANARECQNEDAMGAKAAQQVEAPTPKENTPVTPVIDTTMAQQPPQTPLPVEPTLDTERTNPTPIEGFMQWWTEANPDYVLMCEGTETRECDNPATHVKIHGSYKNSCYPKCDIHAHNGIPAIPEEYLWIRTQDINSSEAPAGDPSPRPNSSP